MRWIWIILVAAPLAAAPLELSLKRAVQLAISPEGSTRVQLSAEAYKQAQLRSLESRAALLPDLSSAFSAQNQTRNLAAFGIRLSSPIPGFSIPTFVGPFSTIDARVSATQSVFDFARSAATRPPRPRFRRPIRCRRRTEEQVAAQVARAYLAAIRADADVAAAQANIALSEAVLKQAENQKAAGTGTGIEITRARVQLANDRQRLLVAENARRSAGLQLLRAMDLRLDTDLVLTDKLEYIPVDAVTLDEARGAGARGRGRTWRRSRSGRPARVFPPAPTKLERLPSVAAFGDYGSIGTGFDNALPTRTYGLSVRVPIFDGGRRDARRAEAASQYRAEKIRTADLKEQIELDVRLALDALHSADEQVTVAREGLDLAENELAQARRRYEAGRGGQPGSDRCADAAGAGAR